jgi:hypothetical protein
MCLVTNLTERAAELDPVFSEGFVVTDSSNARGIARSPQFMALSSLLQENTLFWKADYNTNEKLMFEIVRANKNHHFLTVTRHSKL